jgi:hypothetical protein
MLNAPTHSDRITKKQNAHLANFLFYWEFVIVKTVLVDLNAFS